MKSLKNQTSLLMTILTIVWVFTLPVNAQVNIGSKETPHKFSILELISTNGGLRMPQLTTAERDSLDLASNPNAARGLWIYNKDTDCLEYWNGSAWISHCADVLHVFTVTVSGGPFTYTGSPIHPNATVKESNDTLSEGVDYILSYSDEINAGTAAVIAVGIGKYQGVVGVATFTIDPLATNMTVEVLNAPFTYTGSPIEPIVAVMANDTTLTEGLDYTLSYSDNTNAGTATVTATGTGNYAGSTGSESFTIAPLVTTLTVEVSGGPFIYTGSPVEPSVTVKDNEVTLTEGVDYTLSYSDNINVGTAPVVTATGIGNYAGSSGLTDFSIDPLGNAAFTIAVSGTYTYNGEPIEPSGTNVTVMVGSVTLAEDADYTLSYSNNTNAGTATVTVNGTGNYAGSSGTENFTINPLATALTVEILDGPFTFSGSPIVPEVIVRAGSVTLTEGTDYTLSYSNNTNAGTATVTATGTGNYTGSTGTENFTIDPLEDVAFSVTVSGTYTYNGAAQTPSGANVTVKADGVMLTEGTDYTLTYSDNTNAGTATVHVTGAGNYAGSTGYEYFTINPLATALTVTVSGGPFTYTGSPVEPHPVTVTAGGVALTEGTDYTLSYSNNTNAGNSTATVTATGVGNYAGSTGATNFTIDPLATTLTVTVSGGPYIYTGSPVEPHPVTVTAGGVALTEGADYTLSYSNNTDAGTATVTATGAGNYAGSSGNANFTIEPFVTNNFTVTISGTYTYNGAAQTPSGANVTVMVGSVALTEGVDYTLTYSNNTNAGTAAVVIATGTGNYAGSSGDANFTIDPLATTLTVTVSGSPFIYTRSPIHPNVTVQAGNVTLTEGTDYTLSYNNNTNAGTATVTAIGANNYSGSTGASNFSINPLTATLTVTVSGSPYTYTGAPITPSGANVSVTSGGVVLTADADYTLSYSNNTNAGTAAVIATGIGNYAGSTGSGAFTISPLATTLTVTVSGTYTYNGAAQTPSGANVTVKAGNTTLTAGTDYNTPLSYSNNTNAGTATVSVTGTGNYAGSTGSGAFTISPLATTLTVTVSGTYTYNGTAQTPSGASVTVKAGNTTLTAGTDYNTPFTYSNNINAGTATVTVTGRGNYTGSTGAGSFTIAPLAATLTVTVSGTYVYNGLAQTPSGASVTVRSGATTLTAGTNYTLVYNNNTNAGTATVVAIGAGNYASDTGQGTFTIGKKPVTINGFAIAKQWDNTNSVTNFGTLTFSGLVNGETANVGTTGVTATYSQTCVGVNLTVNYTGAFSMTGGTANPDNYSITQPTGLRSDITPPFTGSGTSASPYLIGTPADMRNLAIMVNDCSWKTTGMYFSMTANISLSTYGSGFNSGKGWIPIGTENTFSGNFNGNYFLVSDLYINDDTQFSVGLFGGVTGGTLQNVGVQGSIIGDSSAGLLASWTDPNSITSNCYSSGTATAIGSWGSVGGLIGWASGIIRNCYSSVIVSGTRELGGLVGYGGTISNCYATGAVNGVSNSGWYVGGLAGNADNITNCYTTSAISGGYTGGLVCVVYGKVENSAALNPSITNTTICARLIFAVDYLSQIGTNVAWNGMLLHGSTVTTEAPHDGISITTQQAKTQSTYTNLGWSFGSSDTSPWKWGGASYPLPVLYWQTTTPTLPTHLQ